MTIICLKCVCEECEKTECRLTVIIGAEEGKAYRPPTRCIAKDKLVAWRIESIEIEEEAGGG